MDAAAGPALVAAVLLVLAGAAKVVAPDTAVGALRGLSLPASALAVRVGAAAEMGLGLAAATLGGIWWLPVAGSYAAFGVFVLAALRSGTMIGSCGCFGREETPPHWSHVLLNVILAAAAGSAAVRIDGPLVDGWSQDPLASIALVGLATVAVYLAWAAFVHLPRTLFVARSLRG